MSVEGIYRVSGFQEEMDSLRLALDKGRILITTQLYSFISHSIYISIQFFFFKCIEQLK